MLFFQTRLVTSVLSPSVLRRENGYLITMSGENSNSCEFSYFPVSKQTVKAQFLLDVLGNSYLFY